MTVNVYAAKTRLSQLIDEAAKGKEVIIARAGEPVAKLVPLTRVHRHLGILKGKFKIPSGFNEPLPRSASRLFEGD
ncbi:MAG: type II toxin-antitoxin system Phd/YefM family antitoxin [Elusimicrobia bacterium]|nr:type II toxin-antitoxin system Phd/YefM family antitoxin [Elusimicrobiota bacterium]